jgi:citrate lyase subunit beta/citryl-CoA lyase
MSDTIHPLRSVLYVPGINERALAKARTLPADALILDLEDAVAPTRKIDARIALSAVLTTADFGARLVTVRINPLSSDWGREDLKALGALPAHKAPQAIVLPKVESAEEILFAARDMHEAGLPDRTAIWAMMETPRGILNVAAIAGCHQRLKCLVMGTSDLSKDLHAAQVAGRLPLLVSLGQCLLAARAYNLSIIDGVHLNLDDAAGFEAACQQGLELGFDGKSLIHPKTIEAANRIFAPGEGQPSAMPRPFWPHGKTRRPEARA